MSDPSKIHRSNKYIDSLVNKLNDCNNDGINCDKCPVSKACVSYWDSICERDHIRENTYDECASNFDTLKEIKHMVYNLSNLHCLVDDLDS